MHTVLHDERLAALSLHLRSGDGDCPFVVRDPPGADVRLTHFSAGRDATYVVIQSSKLENVTIGYAPLVEGTTLIYDVTDQTLQGKARPFDCNLHPSGQRVYALVPVQIESIHVALRGWRLNVEFHDARGERIEAALPFHWTLSGANQQRRASYSSTNRDGQFVRGLQPGGEEISSIAVRSLLTGREERAAINR